ncbi:LysR family transcriptional regulator [Pseudomonas sp. T1.Ur]|uniref:LysR family transcriptional regulator n=1 Tax=Pseudomonas sp. T1.Ur TaxID=2928704 RepID=UPI00201D448E|nr:LysR family transcriptional regulator [Pseudomonas sp. T1.Ur]MCL6701789.1 LysR family transcriptional regulator [Pseudomonas sp. T1.Ur]
MALEDVGQFHDCARLPPSINSDDRHLDNLEDLQALEFFLVTARCSCFMQAARSLNVKASLLRKKLSRLSIHYGSPLFEHRGNALVLSQDGRHLRNQLLAHRALLALPDAFVEDQALVRVAVAEPLLHDILNRELLGFVRQHANVRLDLLRLDSNPDQEPVEADVVVWLTNPQAQAPGLSFPVVELSCLAELEYIPHIAKRYSREASRPRSLAELQDYMLVSLHDYAKMPSLQPWNSTVGTRRSGVTQVNSYELMRQMIQWSACVGLLPHYVCALDKTLQPLPDLFDRGMPMQVWMAIHRDEAHRDEVTRLAALVRAAFEQLREWFQNER